MSDEIDFETFCRNSGYDRPTDIENLKFWKGEFEAGRASVAEVPDQILIYLSGRDRCSF